MKKSVFIWTLAAILSAAALFLLFNNIAAGSGKDLIIGQNQQEAAAPSPSSAPDSTEADSSKLSVPDFTLKDLYGKEWTLSELKGKKVFLNFWATWCGYCEQEMPYIERIYQETKDSDLVILAINVQESSLKAQKFMKDQKLSFNVLLDDKGLVTSTYGISGFPTSIFINSDGTLSDAIPGALEYEDMISYIEKLK